jgi:hypothetical protein
MHHMTNMDENMKNCIEACNECRDECETTLFQHCLKQGGKHVEQAHVKLMADCIEICQTATHFMLRGSDQHKAVCGICADICEACAESCEKIGSEEMKNCAEACRQCAKTCREISGTKGTSSSKKAA